MKILLAWIIAMLLSFGTKAQKVFSVNAGYQADIKIYVVDADYEVDLLVYKVDTD
jgi:hypothetical protein